MRVSVFLLTFFLIAATMAADFQKKEQLNLEAEGIKTLKVDCAAGFLKISGIKESNVIAVQADIILNNIESDRAEEFLEKYLRLELIRDGNTARLVSQFDFKKSFFGSLFGENPGGVVDLTVQVPEGMDVEVDDGSGFIVIKDLTSDVEIDDGSGEITLKNISGNIRIDDGSGEISIENISGDVSIDDGSGEISIRNITGNVRIDDGSGSINIDGVEKDVRIIDSGSGGENIRNVKGRVITQD
ncbi:MAG: hypothetical protein EH225_01620 [Calditrichaeota bacterium]|nr:DUF4097 family beta strand repeat protein [Calditrichota bacterium]RQW07554.1 MAG: hypothetical protein EH225_01620 [Calditrichota bacterium]